MKAGFKCLVVLALASPSLFGCGSPDPLTVPNPGNDAGTQTDGTVGGGADLPPLDGSATIDSLTELQKGQLCDWMMGKLGGYGLMTDCGNSTAVGNPASQAECISTRLRFRCAVTVSELETCVIAMAPTNGCTVPNVECRRLLCV